MFTGLIETTGRWLAFTPTPTGTQLQIEAPLIAPGGVALGDSVAVNGCCLTVTAIAGPVLTFDLLQETLRLTNLGTLAPGSEVNLERALLATARLGGHFVQGHIDGLAPVLGWSPHGADYRLEVELPRAFAAYVIPKGSIAINGISLTIAEVNAASFTAWIIPHTRQVTNLHQLEKGARVNLEFDLLAKYLERSIRLAAGKAD